MGTVMEFTIKNWTKFNPRSDKSNYSWFRFENGFFHDQAVFGLTDSQRCVYIFCLCEASKRNGNPVQLRSDYVAAVLGGSEEKITKDFDELYKVGLLTSSGRPQADFVPATNERTNDTNEVSAADENVCARFVPDLEAAYKKYPKKLGKQEGMKKAKRDIKTREDFGALLVAIDRFVSFHRTKGTEERYIPYFSTFMSSWRDWLDPSTGMIGTVSVIKTSTEESDRAHEESLRKAGIAV